jgi:hypothetical protein
MATSSPQKRKRRRVQLRDAQRRRRARLKTEAKSFLQIILTKETLELLRKRSDAEGKPLHICATEILESGLSVRPDRESTTAPVMTEVAESPVPKPSITLVEENGSLVPDAVPTPSNQMELFA